MYRDGPCFVAKPYTLKVQAAGDGRGRAATLARCTIDLARLCACNPAGSHAELCLPLKCAPLLCGVTHTQSLGHLAASDIRGCDAMVTRCTVNFLPSCTPLARPSSIVQ